MPARLRPRREPTDDWQQRQLLSPFPAQLTDALIRPVVLFGHSPAERAQQTGAARTLYRQAARCSKDGMASLFAPQTEALDRRRGCRVGRHVRRAAPCRAQDRVPSGRHAFPALAGRPLGRYGEHGLGKEHAAVWLYGETLTIAFADEPLARYRVRYQPDTKHLQAVEEPQVYETPFRSPQRALWERDDTEWLQVIRRPDDAPRQARQEPPRRASLFL